MKNQINYGLSWEDSNLIPHFCTKKQRILTIGAAGDFPLSFLTTEPTSLTIVDINQAQLWLTELKIKAFNYLNYEEATDFLGVFVKLNNDANRLQTLKSLSNSLSQESIPFWSSHHKEIAYGIIHSGKFERYINTFAQKVLPFLVKKGALTRFLRSQNLEEQQAIYKTEIDTLLYQWVFKAFFGRFYMAKKGRDPNLLKYVNESIHNTFYSRMKDIFCRVPIQQNYFLRFILTGFFEKEKPLPLWLNAKHFDKVKNATTEVKYQHESIQSYLMRTNEKFDVIYLSNACETLSIEESEKVFKACKERLNPNGILAIWNNMVPRRPDQFFIFDEAFTNQLMKSHLKSFYGFFGIYRHSSAIS